MIPNAHYLCKASLLATSRFEVTSEMGSDAPQYESYETVPCIIYASHWSCNCSYRRPPSVGWKIRDIMTLTGIELDERVCILTNGSMSEVRKAVKFSKVHQVRALLIGTSICWNCASNAAELVGCTVVVDPVGNSPEQL